MFPYVIQDSNITVVIGSTPHAISKSHITYNKVLAAIKANDWDTVQNVINPKKVVLDYGKGYISIQGEKVFWKDQELHNSLTTRMIKMLQEEFPIDPLVAVMENIMENTSKRAVDELYGFLERCNLPITPDGCFLAFKKIRYNYMDVYSSTVPNKPIDVVKKEFLIQPEPIRCGKRKEVTVTFDYTNNTTVVEMERNMVDDDKDRPCSDGLHFCSLDYLNHFNGEKIIIVKINPKDVVSFPSDYDSKGRTCRYEIVSELGVDPEAAFDKPVQMSFSDQVI